jgi:hypothetical protein
VSENRVLRRVLGPEREEVTGGWRKLNNEEIHNSYYSPNTIRLVISRGIRYARQVARMWRMRIAYKILVGKSEGKK